MRMERLEVTTCDGVTDLIGFVFVEEEDLVSFGHCFRAAHVADVDAAIGEDEVRSGGAFLGTFVRHVPAQATSHSVTVGVVRSGRESKSGMGRGCAAGAWFSPDDLMGRGGEDKPRCAIGWDVERVLV